VAGLTERQRVNLWRGRFRDFRAGGPTNSGCHRLVSGLWKMPRQFSLGGLAFALLVIGMALCPATAAMAQSKLVKLDVSSQSPPIRTNAPMTFVWRIESESQTPIDGQLAVTVLDGETPLISAVDEVVISPGTQLIRTVVPPVDPQGQLNAPELRVALVVKGKVIGSWQLTMSNGSTRQYQRKHIVAFCDAWSSSLPAGASQLLEQLRMETWNANTNDRTINTFPARVLPADLPEDPLGYCGFDVVVVAEEAFAELRERQTRALLDWVAAGGSVGIVPGGAVLKDYHVAALNQLARAKSEEPQFVLDGAGRLIGNNVEAETPRLLLKRYGLGRAAVFRGKLADLKEGRQADLRQVAAFLWKLRHDHWDEFQATGQFHLASDVPVSKEDPNAPINQYGYNPYNVEDYNKLRPQDMPLATLPLRSGDQLVARLMPEGLKIVPLSLIGLILFGYVVLIGPTDWIVLGAIRRRKWTWFTFPFVTVAITLFTVWLAEWYMQVNDRRRTFTVQDVGVDNQIARKSRFEVLFQGSEHDVKTEVNRELFADMNLQRFSDAFWQSAQIRRMQGQSDKPLHSSIPLYAGRLPSRYQVTQFISQWTPQLNRRSTILRSKEATEADPNAKRFDWDKFANFDVYRPETLTANAPNTARETLLKDVEQAFGPGTHVALYVNGKRQNIQRNFEFLQGEDVYGIDANGNQIAQQRMYRQYGVQNAAKPHFLDDISLQGQGGLFSVVSQISPNGGRDFDDLALVDPSDPEQWLLVIAVAQADDVDVYRKLYKKGD